eukprot:Rhum_TRINITY_DN12043_c0_g1::Rhum_TRINITY_DN12043_c0_g1_i3::g.48553::m.48553
MSYTGVFLTPESRDELLAWCATTFGPPLDGGRVVAEHMTIKFRPSQEEAEAVPLHSYTALRVVGYACDNHVQAVVVAPRLVSSANPVPHITICCRGKPPFYSNACLARGYTAVPNGPWLVGRVRHSRGGLSPSVDDDVWRRVVAEAQALPAAEIEVKAAAATATAATAAAPAPPHPMAFLAALALFAALSAWYVVR